MDRIAETIKSLNLSGEFTITNSLIEAYIHNYSNGTGKLKPRERQLAYKLAALNLIKYKRANSLYVGEGFLYIIGNPAWPGMYKIGMTIDVEDRLSSYQTYSPLRDYYLVHYRFTNNRRAYERKLHDMLKDVKVRGEWFEIPSDDALQSIKEILGC